MRQPPAFLYPALAAPLVVWAWIGSYARYAADDYCTASILRTRGFLAAQTYWYTSFSPRYAFTFVVSLAELVGPALVPVLPSLALIGWLAALTWSLHQFGVLVPAVRSLGVCLVVAETLVFGTLSTTPDIGQSLYWQTGMLTYLLPLVLLTLVVGGVARATTRGLSGRPPHPLALLPVGLLTAFAGGLSETYLAAQTGGLLLGVLAALAARARPAQAPGHVGAAWRAATPYLAAGLLGSIVALGLEAVSPALAGREQSLQPPLGLAIEAAVRVGMFFVVRFVRNGLPIILVCLGIPLLLGGTSGSDPGARPLARLGQVGLVGAATLLLVLGCFFPAFYALGADPPARALVIPDALLIGFLIYAGLRLQASQPLLRLAILWPGAPAAALALGLLACVPLVRAASTLAERATAASYAAQWDAEDGQIRAARAAGQTRLVVEPLPPNLGEPFVGPDPRDWFNTCVARFYDLDSIATP